MTFFGKLKIAVLGAAIVSSSVASAQTDWKDRFSVGGDLRYRVQRDLEGRTNTTTDDWTTQLRARLNVEAKVNDAITAHLRVGTGEVPQTGYDQMTGASSTKRFGLLLGYLDYKLTDSISFALGKAPNPFWSAGQSAMVWSPDMNFEGLQAKWAGDMGDLKPFITLNYATMLDRGGNNTDINMFGAQIGTSWSMEPLNIGVAVGMFSYNNMKGLPKDAGLAPHGNSTIKIGEGPTPDPEDDIYGFAHEFNLMNAGLEVGYDLGFAPITAFVDYVQNSDPSERNKGMLGGLALGKLEDVGSWMVRVSYRDLEQDATLGYFADPYFLGGGTDVRGTELSGAYMFMANTSVGFTWNTGVRNASAGEQNYENYYIDFTTTF